MPQLRQFYRLVEGKVVPYDREFQVAIKGYPKDAVVEFEKAFWVSTVEDNMNVPEGAGWKRTGNPAEE